MKVFISSRKKKHKHSGTERKNFNTLYKQLKFCSFLETVAYHSIKIVAAFCEEDNYVGRQYCHGNPGDVWYKTSCVIVLTENLKKKQTSPWSCEGRPAKVKQYTQQTVFWRLFISSNVIKKFCKTISEF